MASFQAQYGLRLSRELDSMKWNEFKALLVGIGPDTPLGRIVSIRSENDEDVLKYFTADQNRIRNEWRNRRVKTQVSKADQTQMLEQIKKAFISMAGGILD